MCRVLFKSVNGKWVNFSNQYIGFISKFATLTGDKIFSPNWNGTSSTKKKDGSQFTNIGVSA